MPAAGNVLRKRLAASPLARRLAREAGVDLAGLTGSGPEGRIVERDVEQMLAAATAPGAGGPARRASAPGVLSALAPHHPLRAAAAERVVLAQRTVPQLALSIDCRLDALLAARQRTSKATTAAEPGVGRISLTAVLVKALALALRDVPAANATWSEAGLQRHCHCDIAVSVAVEGGYLTPVVRQAEAKPPAAIAGELADLVARARAGSLTPEHCRGGASAIHNLGMHAIARMEAIVTPPRAMCLTVGAAEPRPVVAGAQLAVGTVMSCTLAADLRVVDAVVAANLLARLRAMLEEPGRIMA